MNKQWWKELDEVQQKRYDKIKQDMSGGHIHTCPECRDYVLNGDS